MEKSSKRRKINTGEKVETDEVNTDFVRLQVFRKKNFFLSFFLFAFSLIFIKKLNVFVKKMSNRLTFFLLD